MYHDDRVDVLRYMNLYFNKKEDKEMDDNNTITPIDPTNDMLKAAYKLQQLCKNMPVDCLFCPFRKGNGLCVFKANPAPPHEWNIEEKTMYTVKLPDV